MGVVTRVVSDAVTEAAITGGSDVDALAGGVRVDALDERTLDVDALGVTIAVAGAARWPSPAR